MLDDLSEAYNAQRRGQPPALPPARLQYPDFAAWQARREGTALHARQVMRCSIALSGSLPVPLSMHGRMMCACSKLARLHSVSIAPSCCGAESA